MSAARVNAASSSCAVMMPSPSASNREAISALSALERFGASMSKAPSNSRRLSRPSRLRSNRRTTSCTVVMLLNLSLVSKRPTKMLKYSSVIIPRMLVAVAAPPASPCWPTCTAHCAEAPGSEGGNVGGVPPASAPGAPLVKCRDHSAYTKDPSLSLSTSCHISARVEASTLGSKRLTISSNSCLLMVIWFRQTC